MRYKDRYLLCDDFSIVDYQIYTMYNNKGSDILQKNGNVVLVKVKEITDRYGQ
jgi:hypothetical protein